MIVAPAFQYLARILKNTINNCNPAALSDPDCVAELEDAVEGIEDFCLGLEERIDGQKALIVALEGQIERLERRIDRQVAR